MTSSNKTFSNKVEKYFDNKKKDIIDSLDPSYNYDYKFSTDKNNNSIVEVLKNGKLVIKAEYELLGLYNLFNSVWYWGYGLDLVNRDLVKISKSIKDFSKTIKKNYNDFDKKEAEILYFRTNNNNFYTAKKNIENIVKLGLYITKSIWFLPVCYNNDNIPVSCEKISNDGSIKNLEYLIIKKIIQYG
jgi:hypothetical protein